MRQAGVGADVSAWVKAATVAAGLAAMLSVGCASNKEVACAPTPDDCDKPIVIFSAPVTEDMLDTPSTAFIEASDVEPAVVQRDWDEMTSYYAPQVVQHWPLYFEDPFEDKGKSTGCGYAGWTWEDFFAIPYSDARWLLNTIALPVSMVVTPPWTPMCSDGVLSKQALGYDHDAVRCPAPVPTPLDLLCPDEQAAALMQISGPPVQVPADLAAPAELVQ